MAVNENTIPYIVKLQATTLEQNLNTLCESCFLPSGYDCTYAVCLDGQPLEVLKITGCIDCGPKES